MGSKWFAERVNSFEPLVGALTMGASPGIGPTRPSGGLPASSCDACCTADMGSLIPPAGIGSEWAAAGVVWSAPLVGIHSVKSSLGIGSVGPTAGVSPTNCVICGSAGKGSMRHSAGIGSKWAVMGVDRLK